MRNNDHHDFETMIMILKQVIHRFVQRRSSSAVLFHFIREELLWKNDHSGVVSSWDLAAASLVGG
ncbi:hypothetical protein BIT28_25655 [Photobacterium proteolyticum]|uniref:Uncharacterized protein n=1 Tax=Photobacterium proteolyticum TaxID=1903952 RepID=A0A1Q9GFN8_9GAMM|nr:hypothetical protein BIT28_25655 [Photobacterium proteolyticum]